MHTRNSVKVRAKEYRSALRSVGHSISVSESLEFISIVEGYKNWNSYSASLKKNRPLLPIPSDWYVHRESQGAYDIGLSPTVNYNGALCATIRCLETLTETDSFVTLMQSISATEFAGKRISLVANLKSNQCDGAVTIWLRIDGAGDGSGDCELLEFDNMENRDGNGPITGTTNWTKRSIVLDVPVSATSINYGFYLRGNGEAFASGFSLEPVTADFPITKVPPTLLDKPTNLDF